ncbi:MAG: PqqD family protein [Chloroflexi bacterium]|nr:PqqD family protein [Chloroflexota bacterium]
MTAKASLQSKISIAENVLFREIDGESVILNLKTGKYFGLDEVGTRMWTHLAEHHQVEPALAGLAQEYQVDQEQLKRDLLELVDKLAAQELIRVDGS